MQFPEIKKIPVKANFISQVFLTVRMTSALLADMFLLHSIDFSVPRKFKHKFQRGVCVVKENLRNIA